MGLSRARRLSLPAFALMVAILAATSLMVVTHLRSLSRERAQMELDLRRQGTIIVRTLESGARTGMMMRWGKEQLQALLEEAVKVQEIAYVGIFDREGNTVVAAIPEGSSPWPGTERIRAAADGEPQFEHRSVDGTGVFEVTTRFVPRSRHGRMGQRIGRMPPIRIEGEELEWVIVLGLHSGPWEEILREGRRQAFLSLFVLAVSGSIAIYIGIVLQNYFVVRRTLGDMRAYAQNVLENMADGLLSVDGKGRVDTFNKEALRILRREGEDLGGLEVTVLLPVVAEIVGDVLAGRRERGELEVLPGGKGEGGPADVAVSPLRSEEGTVTGAVLLLRDLTEVRRLQEKIRESEKLAALGQMAATVAHEVRNPLSSLKGFAQLFAGKFDEGSAEAGYARLMVGEVDRLNRTVSDLLFYSRPVELRQDEIRIGDLLRETARLLEPEVKASGQRLDLESVGDLAVTGDADQLRRVFLNLLLNAHQVAGEGGRISLAAAPSGEGWCTVEVSDDGPGMGPEVAAKAFEPFFTTREKGSGLGLAIVRKIVELHGGRVSLHSAPGGGTVVTVELPV